jgi:membrane dipeptidase
MNLKGGTVSSEPGMWMIDGHSDWLLDIADTKRSFFEQSDIGHVDLPRLKQGQISAMMCAVFVRNDDLPHHALIQTLRMVDRLRRIVDQSEGQVRLVETLDDLDSCQKDGVFGAILHYEGAEAIDPEFAVLRLSYALGLRSLGLTWSRSNIFSEGVGEHNRERGLTYLGKELVRKCNDLGVLVDVSHLNVAGFWDVLETSKVPIVASHSNARAICDHERNLYDDQIRALARNGGLMGINFARQFLVEGAREPEDVSLDQMIDHVDHIVNLVGIDHVALGSDYDGAGMPAALYDAAQTPILIDALRKRGYDDESIQKFGRDNWVRVLGQVWK